MTWLKKKANTMCENNVNVAGQTTGILGLIRSYTQAMGLPPWGTKQRPWGWGLCQPDDLQRATVIIQDNRDNRDNRRHIFESKSPSP